MADQDQLPTPVPPSGKSKVYSIHGGGKPAAPVPTNHTAPPAVDTAARPNAVVPKPAAEPKPVRVAPSRPIARKVSVRPVTRRSR